MIYLLNSPVIPNYGDYRLSGPLDRSEAKERLRVEYTSAIGHQATADLLSRLLQLDINAHRTKISMNIGDSALIFRLTTRLPENTLLTEAQLAQQEYELSWMERLA